MTTTTPSALPRVYSGAEVLAALGYGKLRSPANVLWRLRRRGLRGIRTARGYVYPQEQVERLLRGELG